MMSSHFKISFLFAASLCASLGAEQSENKSGEWLPERVENYKPFLAAPREITHSIGFRYNDQATASNIAAVSFGEELPFYQWNDVRKKGDSLQLGIHGAIWSVFDMETVGGDILEHTNSDFLVGFPLTYSYGDYAIRARFYHLSSHLGDEYLVNNPTVERKNPSFETIDCFLSYNVASSLRLYGGGGYVLQMDASYRGHRLSVEYGFETRFLGAKDEERGLFHDNFLAMHMRHLEDKHWNYDGTLRIGTEFGKIGKENGKKVRAFLEFHEGYSLEGQFTALKTDYLSFNIGYGY
jgi:hypothetical protein